jgi:hypothetical protein
MVMGYQQILRLSALQIFTTTSVVFQPSPNGTFCVGWRVSVWQCLASLKLRPNGGIRSPWFSGSMFFVHEIILGRPGKRSDGTDCPQALVPRQGDQRPPMVMEVSD